MSGGPQEVTVLRYGSDPLKTYLPESDVDITVIVKEGNGKDLQSRTALSQLKM